MFKVVFLDPNIFLCIPASAADGAAVNPKGINTLFANGWIRYFINGNLVLNKGQSILPKNPPDRIIFLIYVLESFISVDVLLLKAFFIFVFCLILSNNSSGKSFWLNIFRLIFKVVPVLFLTASFSFFFIWVFDNHRL